MKIRARRPSQAAAGWRVAAWLLRGFAFGLIGVLGLAVFYAPQLRAILGADSWGASLVPSGPAGILLWLCAAMFNAGAALFLAEHLES